MGPFIVNLILSILYLNHSANSRMNLFVSFMLYGLNKASAPTQNPVKAKELFSPNIRPNTNNAKQTEHSANSMGVRAFHMFICSQPFRIFNHFWFYILYAILFLALQVTTQLFLL